MRKRQALVSSQRRRLIRSSANHVANGPANHPN